MIQVTNLGKLYGSHLVLQDINMHVHEGEIFGIVGHSGAGKSTLLRCLNGLEPYQMGSVKVMGVEVASLEGTALRMLQSKMGMIFQNFNLMSRKNVFDNVAFPLSLWGVAKREERVMELLELVGLADRAKQRVQSLSGGQKQRVGIARALALNPRVLLCDEATSALDPTTTRAILRLIQDINRRLGITVIVITHEMAVVEEICTHVAILEHGRMVETGTVEEVFSNPKTEAGRRLVYPEGAHIDQFPAANVVRIAFNGGSSYEPLIASLAIDCGVKVNILGADTRNVSGKAFGSRLLGLPQDAAEAARALSYLRAQKDVTVEEVRDYHA